MSSRRSNRLSKSNDGKTKTSSASKLFADLHREMELTAPSKNESGQNVKRHPRHLRPELTKKRKSLEEADRSDMAMEVREDSKRIRGSKVAFEDVVLNSMPLMGVSAATNDDDSDGIIDEDDDEVDADDILEDVNELGIDIGEGDSNSGNDDDYSGEDDESETETQEDTINVPLLPPMDTAHETTNKSKRQRSVKRRKRKIYRLRNFSSHRLALRHGEALGAHIRGDSATAVQKLRDVAKAAPGAPQVYSSLGMVYESMLEDLEKQLDEASDAMTALLQQKKIELAHKTYASLHVAAVLCKRDFTLWERSGDIAIKLVHIYRNMITSATHWNKRSSNLLADWQKERTIWLEHALSAYSSADNLRPPGVDVPCKLAQVHIEQGNFMNALTILSGLRNKRSTDMEGSYPCWLLYADLMMKIGYECKRWNRGTSSDQTYMAKRWLRKHSAIFDWKERRLQALCLALEAAAGSKSCAELSRRMKQRTKELFMGEAEKDTDQDANKDTMDTIPTSTSADDKNSAMPDKKDQHQEYEDIHAYDNERSNLVKRNEIERQKFDWESLSMNLVEGSRVHKDRMAKRASLIEKHRASIRALANRSYNTSAQTAQIASDDDESDTLHLNLPLQASCATVCQIAELLLTQCVQSRLYEDGLVVAKSVLSYYKERSARHKRKLEKQKRLQLIPKPTQGFDQPSFEYDCLNFDSDDSDVDEDGYIISDEEDLENSDNLDALEKGILPVNIRAFYSLCLVGAGGHDFVAMSYLEKVVASDELELLKRRTDDDTPSTEWTLFQTQFNLPLNKTSLLALVVDIVKNKTFSQREKLRGMLKRHLDALDNKHGLDQIMSANEELLREHATKILFACYRSRLESAEIDLESLNESNKNDSDSLRKVISDGLSALNTVIRFQHVLWRPNRGSDWSLPAASLETLEILSRAMCLLSHVISSIQDVGYEDIIKATSLKSKSIVAIICDVGNHDTVYTGDQDKVLESLKSFPLPCDWQSTFQKSLSVLSYNLCVGCCVSAFSGWHNEEFNLDQLHSQGDSNIFGLDMEGPYVAGFISQEATTSLSRQWECIHSLIPHLEPIRYDACLHQRKDKDWYQKLMGIVKREMKNSNIASFREGDGLMTLLSFSMICLVAAEHSDADESDQFLKLALSVILPMTQFSIDKAVWNSKIGARAISEMNETSIGYYVDENKQWLGPTKDARRKANTSNTKKPSHDQFSQRVPSIHRPVVRRSNRSGFFGIHVPTSILLGQWNNETAVIHNASNDAIAAMKAVDDSMKNLRKSRTINALERSSLDVAVALVNVSSHSECQNPFLSLQQAAVFAAMGPKLGNSDEPFKAFLPRPNKASALEALVILGRADCMRAVHFVESAQFLCSWVARVCTVRRSNLEEELPWTSRWRVIGAYLAFVSANVDGTAAELDIELTELEEAVTQEIENGKSDARTILGSHHNASTSNSKSAWATNNAKMPALEDSNPQHETNDFDKPECPVNHESFNLENHDSMQEEADLFAGINWASV